MNHPADLIPFFSRQRALVVGDAILDVYAEGSIDKLCREAPVPVVRLHQRIRSCGGAANTAVNTAALGGHVRFVTVAGTDVNGDFLAAALDAGGVDTGSAIRVSHRRTITKTRVCAGGNILVRVDEGDTDPIDTACAIEIARTLRDELRRADVAILSDYGCGVFSEFLMRELQEIPRSDWPPIVIDAKHPERFRGLAPAAVKPNYAEAAAMLGLKTVAHGKRVEQVLAHGGKLLECTGAGFVAVTLDMDGTIIFERGRRPHVLTCMPQPDRKTIGAGDSFIGGLSLAIAAGASPRMAARIAAAAAAIAIEKNGTGICTRNELEAHFQGRSKHVSGLDALERIVHDLKQQNRRIVFTNGCFDILHRGHVEFLRQARSLGDVLIVALNSDESIRRIKGSGRPVNSLEDRMEVLSALQAVDFLVQFESESPAEILRAVRPHVLAKGGTYDIDTLPEADLVRALGGEVEIIPFSSDLTTSGLIEKIQRPAVVPAAGRSSHGAL